MTPPADRHERDATRRPGAERRRRLADAILREASEAPRALIELVGAERAAEITKLPATAVEALLLARPTTQRRFAGRLRERLGLDRAAVAAASALPDDESLARAVRYFGVALRLANEPRVLPRERRRALAQAFGEDAVVFGLPRRTELGQSARSLSEIVRGEPGGRADAALFTAALAAGENDLAAGAALRLGLPPPPAARAVTDALGAPIDALPGIAAAALVEAARADIGRDDPAGASFIEQRGAA